MLSVSDRSDGSDGSDGSDRSDGSEGSVMGLLWVRRGCEVELKIMVPILSCFKG